MQAEEVGMYLEAWCVSRGSGGHWFSKYKDSLHHLHSKREGILIPLPLRIYVCDETGPGVQ